MLGSNSSFQNLTSVGVVPISLNEQGMTDLISQIFQRIILITLGFSILFLNVAVTITIFHFRKLRLRTELVIFCALAWSDIICGLAYSTYSIRQLHVILTRNTDPILPIECMKVFGTNLHMIGPELLTIMMLVISIDRLFSLVNVRKYRSLGRFYLSTAIGVPTAIVAVSYGTVWYMATWVLKSPVDVACSLGTVGGKYWYLFNNLLQITCATASVVVYFVIFLLFKRQRGRVSPKLVPMEPGERRQLTMTKTVGFMCVCTLLLYVIPQACLLYFGYFFTGSPGLLSIAQSACRTITSAYSCSNIIVYLARPSDVRTHMRILWEQIWRRYGTRSKPDVDPTKPSLRLANIKSAGYSVSQAAPIPGTKLIDLDIGTRKRVIGSASKPVIIRHC